MGLGRGYERLLMRAGRRAKSGMKWLTRKVASLTVMKRRRPATGSSMPMLHRPQTDHHELGALAPVFSDVMKNFSEPALARAALIALDRLEAGAVSPNALDGWFTAMDCRLTDATAGASLSDEAQELIIEGEHLHHYGDALGPDVSYLRKLAGVILQRADVKPGAVFA